ncbi:hypothetical protein OESDEN_10605 [Oesophagostomum dentatum]|uniref:Peptidase S1 domain-containing protein n=1 Tax=Oesophagostomum dentatum TaxID=61180 RepID=A0A0B1T1C2_OESDE|nr:hypothetical protein OESDEN_10605 [Oesophagostomum dentatum]
MNFFQGDSGGPLFYSSDGIFTLLGITSSTSDACTKSSTGGESYFIDVRANLDWICDETGTDFFYKFTSLPGVMLERIQKKRKQKETNVP